MAWRLVRQPNGKLARFSAVVDDFTDYDMTDEEAWTLCRDAGGIDVAKGKIARVDADPERFEEALQIIRRVHGRTEAEKTRRDLGG